MGEVELNELFKVGYLMKRLVKKIINRISSSCFIPSNFFQKQGFVDDVFGFKLYQNVDDIDVHYGHFSGKELKDVGRLWQDGELSFLVNEIKQGYKVIDIGANVGIISLLLSKLVGPQGRVIAFEPGPISFKILELNVLINGCKNIQPVNMAVSSKSGKENLFISQGGESDNQVSEHALDWGFERRASIVIETVSLDEYLKNNNINNTEIDYIKMDTQGGEYKVLQGMKNILSQNKKIRLTIEYAPYLPLWSGLKRETFLDFIRSFGFKIYDLKGGNPVLVSNQYLINKYPRNLNKKSVGIWTTLLLQRI